MISDSFHILEYSDDAIIIECLEERKIAFANDAAASVLDLPKEELPGKSLEQLIQPFPLPGSLSGWHRKSRFLKLSEYRLDTDKGFKLIKLLPVEEPVNRQDIENLNRVAGVLVHRLRSPLNAIGGFFELIKPDDNQYEDEVTAIEQGIGRMEHILSEIKMIQELPERTPGPVNIGQMVEEVREQFGPNVHKAITWNTKVKSTVESDFELLKVVMEVLITNAVEAAETVFDDIEVEISHQRYLSIKVRNYGQTIPRKNISQLFKPFFTTKAKNTGLGLTKAYIIVKKLGGVLFLCSNSSIEGICFEARV